MLMLGLEKARAPPILYLRKFSHDKGPSLKFGNGNTVHVHSGKLFFEKRTDLYEIRTHWHNYSCSVKLYFVKENFNSEFNGNSKMYIFPLTFCKAEGSCMI